MVAAQAHNETVYTVLASAARQRSTRSLQAQLIVSTAIATAILLAAPHWWSLAFLAGWSAAYATWGLLVRVADARSTHPRSLDALLSTIAALGTALAVAGIIGFGLAIYSGNGGGVKNACGKGNTNKICQAQAHPTPSTNPIR